MSRTSHLLWSQLFERFAGQSCNLQGQIRDMLAHAIIEGFLLPNEPLPSSRMLADSLGISRTTVTLAMYALLDKGFVVSKERSGYFVAEKLQPTYLSARKRAEESASTPTTQWANRLISQPSAQRNIFKPPNWQELPYPFIYGQFDATLFPHADWRECVLQTLQPRTIREWAPDHIAGDDTALIEQIQRRLLPARGIWVEQDEILITSGAQQATFLLAQLLVGPQTQVGIENPGYPDARNNFSLRTPHIRHLSVDKEGVMISSTLSRCNYVFVTPSHQCPTTVTMSLRRRHKLLASADRHDFFIFEDDHESELNFSGQPTPALKSLDTNHRVIYIGSLSKTLAHGLRLGFVVASAELIQELRALRRLMMRHVPTNNQRAAANFIARGHHDAFMRRLNVAYQSRSEALKEALANYAPMLTATPVNGGSAIWVTGPKDLDARELAKRALEKGVLIEPGDIFFSGKKRPQNHMRIGYSSIALDHIEAGMRILGQHLN
ncbi:PLP-dependent aminotransferase family protein [Allopusillimonas ginsengisoli]|nr:PLP-dependent aminotransferase family protein [Allopusillimonas ginsengisoli]